MGDKFDRVKGIKYVEVGAKKYGILFTINQIGYFNALCAKNDQEKIVPFLYDRFVDAFKEINKDSPNLVSELASFETELTNLVLSNFDEVQMEVMVSLGKIKREVADKLKNQEQLLENPAFLSQITQQNPSGGN